MKGFVLALALLAPAMATTGVEAGLFHKKPSPSDQGVATWDPGLDKRVGLFHRKPAEPEVPGGLAPGQLVAPNGVVVPKWASKRIQESPVPLFGKSWGRRPWAMPLAEQNTPSARMARADLLGFGAGPIPGYTNGPPLGNYPTASVGPNGPGLPATRGLFGPIFPNNIYITGD